MACGVCGAQVIVPRTLNMQQVIALAQENSIASMSNRNTFVSRYWSYRSYKAEMLPSLNLSADLVQFDRSLVALQDYQTGAISYRTNYNLTNSARVYVSQNVPWTGGNVSLTTSLRRLDQYSPMRSTTYYAAPISLSYTQSIWGYNRFKWSRKTEPKNYELAKRQYIENMESVSQTAVTYFWTYVREKEDCQISDTQYPGITRDMISDVEVMTADYLINSIDHAFKQWKNRPWAKHLSYEEFRDWILPYKVTEYQSLDNWRDVLSEFYSE